jgi:hypothetical protein
MKVYKVQDIFNDDGNFTLNGYDPYHVKEAYRSFHDVIFESDGELQDKMGEFLWDSIDKKSYKYNSDIVSLYHAVRFSSVTKGNYTANFYWK